MKEQTFHGALIGTFESHPFNVDSALLAMTEYLEGRYLHKLRFYPAGSPEACSDQAHAQDSDVRKTHFVSDLRRQVSHE